jgi:N6-adenosine-specific RNA methylase IME4
VTALRYRTIVADPPWQVKTGPDWASNGPSRDLTYPTLTVDEIKALPVRGLSDNVDDDAHLYLWTINAYLRDAFDVARSWGFHHSATICWCKEPMGSGLGGTWVTNVEFVLFCRRPKVTTRPDVLAVSTFLADAADRSGMSRREIDFAMGTSDMAGWWLSRLEHRCACPTNEQWARLKTLLRFSSEMDDTVHSINTQKGTYIKPRGARNDTSWFTWPRGPHSVKPDAFLDLVEQVSPGPYLELFARRQRLGWDTWGDEALNHVNLEAGGM